MIFWIMNPERKSLYNRIFIIIKISANFFLKNSQKYIDKNNLVKE